MGRTRAPQNKQGVIRLDTWRKLSKGTLQDRTQEWDSDEEIPELYLGKGKTLEVWDVVDQRWVACRILEYTGELISFKMEGSEFVRWVDSYSEGIAPEGSKIPRAP